MTAGSPRPRGAGRWVARSPNLCPVDPETLTRPVGPLSEATYWRRRLVTLTVPVLSVLLLAWACAGGADPSTQSLQVAAGLPVAADPGQPPAAATTAIDAAQAAPVEESSSRSPSPSPSAKATPTAKAVKAVKASPKASAPPRITACSADDLSVDAATDERTAPAGDPVRLVLSVRNTSRSPCTSDLGGGAVELRVISGEDRIWSSDHCSPGSGKDVVRLDTGEQRAFRVNWNGSRSKKGCAKAQPEALPGTYRVVGRVGELTRTGGVFLLR